MANIAFSTLRRSLLVRLLIESQRVRRLQEVSLGRIFVPEGVTQRDTSILVQAAKNRLLPTAGIAKHGAKRFVHGYAILATADGPLPIGDVVAGVGGLAYGAGLVAYSGFAYWREVSTLLRARK